MALSLFLVAASVGAAADRSAPSTNPSRWGALSNGTATVVPKSKAAAPSKTKAALKQMLPRWLMK